jgi:multidrug resistance efflux pump
MTWVNRVRLAIGLVLVLALGAVLTVAFSQRRGEAESSTASILAVEYPVGTDYAGAVVDQFVWAGDSVRVGDPIVTMQSNDLLQDLGMGIPLADSEVFDLHDDGTLTIKSTVDGVIRDMDVQQGGYASVGSTIGTILATDTLFAEAEFVLDPKDYARIEPGALVSMLLPNGAEIEGEVSEVEVTTADGQAVSTVRFDSPQLQFESEGCLVTPGTPITATMELRNDDPLATVIDQARRAVGDFVGMFTA